MAYIYKIWNDINNKVYIGKTNRSLKTRFHEHCRDSKKENRNNRPLYKAMNKYGVENFHIEELEETSRELSSKRECYWIGYYNSFHNGYNATKGGDGKPWVDEDEIISLFESGKSKAEIRKIIVIMLNIRIRTSKNIFIVKVDLRLSSGVSLTRI